jgi:drug/metabolite transporter (DMT)-like permease
MCYAFSRDGAIPGWRFWSKLNSRRVPARAVIFMAVLGAIITVPAYFPSNNGGVYVPVAFYAVVSIAVIGLYIAYVIPTFLRLRQGDSFKRGPWHLGRWSYLVGTIAVVWVILITILFMLPTASPIGWGNFNYTVVAVVAVLGFAGIYWLVSARNWFTGPRVQGTAEELAAIEQELSV